MLLLGSVEFRRFAGHFTLPHNFRGTVSPHLADPSKRERPHLKPVLVILALGILLVPTRGVAQISPLHWEVRGGAWISAVDLTGATGFEGAASAAASFGVHFALRSGLISYVVGFSEHRFGCSQAECGGAVDFVSTAWDLGVRFNFREAGIIPWASVGTSAALVNACTATGGATTSESSDGGWGFEVGAGVVVPVGGPFALNPGVRYGRNDVAFDSRGTLETRYIIADLGLVLTF